MSYSPTVWNDGDTIDATKLNKIEQGIAEASSGGGGGASILVVQVGTGLQLQQTFSTIKDAVSNGVPVFLSYSYNSIYYLCPLVALRNVSGQYRLAFSRPKYMTKAASTSSVQYVFSPCMMIYSASSPSAYPEFLENVSPYTLVENVDWT